MTIETAWEEKKFEVIWTEDGSPSLKPLDGFEMMHHRGGAYAETQLIYGEPVREVLAQGGDSFLSIGLGLGYNELVIASEALKSKRATINLRSFETEPVLKKELLEFVQSGSPQNPRQEIYLEIIQRLSGGSEIPRFLNELYVSGSWTLDGALDLSTTFPMQAQGILFDAFSAKTSPGLWTEDFLVNFLGGAAADYCLFSTYACTGPLKRALKASGFEVVLRSGFHGKRNSTLGRKGI
jgi:tRNA U34 5-methylaminomethyl-2-thiouridine-forming methyltransferase MnmC